MCYSLLVLLALGLTASNGQRVAPGVPPQHYQQPPPQYQQHPQQQQQYQTHPQQNLPPGVNSQQYQQQPIHQQPIHQVPVEQHPPVQQVPVNQQVPVQQVPVQQVPQGHGNGHHAPHGHHGQVLNAANIQDEREHIQEHMKVPINTSKMTEAELQFHYFKMHDSDNNNKLDGCELIKSLIHWHATDEQAKQENKVYSDQELSDIMEQVLKNMDSDDDGFINYREYRQHENNSAKSN